MLSDIFLFKVYNHKETTSYLLNYKIVLLISNINCIQHFLQTLAPRYNDFLLTFDVQWLPWDHHQATQSLISFSSETWGRALSG